MAIQQRHGANADFDATKMLPGELAVTTDGSRKVYVAFAPGDAKELASAEEVEESIQNGIEEIEQKKEEALAQFPNYEDKITELEIYKANSIITTSTGQTIYETDCAAVSPANIKLFGKGKQETVPGNQLFDDVTYFNEQGFIVTNEGWQGDGALRSMWTNTKGIEGSIIIEFDYKSLAHHNTFIIEVHYTDGTQELLSTWAYNEWVHNRVVTKADNTVDYIKRTYVDAGSFVISNIMISTSGVPYEQYVGGEASPNMNYPQIPEFHGESGSIVGEVLTSNLFKLLNRELAIINDSEYRPENPRHCNGNKLYVGISGDNYFITTHVKSYEIAENTIKFIPNANSYGIGFDYLVKENQTYSIGYDIDTTNSYNVWFNFLDKNGYHLNYSEGNIINGGKSFTVPEGANYVIITFVGMAGIEYVFANVRMHFGETLLPCEIYTEQPFTVLTPNGLRGIPLGTTIPDAIANSDIHMSGVYWDEEEGQYYIGDYRDYNSGKDVQLITEFTVDGGEENGQSWWTYSSYNGFARNVMPFIGSRRDGFCNQALVRTAASGLLSQNGMWLGVDNNVVYLINNSFFDSTLEDYGLANLKAHLDENPLVITTWLDEPITTDLTDEEIAQYNALVMNYPNTTIVNDAGAYMEVTHVKDTQKHIEQNYISKAMHEEHESRIAELEKAIVNS